MRVAVDVVLNLCAVSSDITNVLSSQCLHVLNLSSDMMMQRDHLHLHSAREQQFPLPAGRCSLSICVSSPTCRNEQDLTPDTAYITARAGNEVSQQSQKRLGP